MKKVAALFLTVAMLAALFVSCNKDVEKTPEPTESESETQGATERPTEDSKATDKVTEPEEEKKGCGGVIATTAVVMTSVLALGAAFVAKKKED